MNLLSIFPKYRNEIEFYEYRLERQRDFICEKNKEIKQYEKDIIFIDGIKKYLNEGYHLISLLDNHSCILLLKSNASIDFYVYADNANKLSKTGNRLYATIHESHIFIEDIQVEINKGYGTALLQSLIKYGSMIGIPKIKGRLETSDLNDHKGRLYHFCTKNGFTITENKIMIDI